jgi:hypothetical protein
MVLKTIGYPLTTIHGCENKSLNLPQQNESVSLLLEDITVSRRHMLYESTLTGEGDTGFLSNLSFSTPEI